MKLKFQELLPLPRGEGWGEGLNAHRFLGALRDFCPLGQKHILLR